MKQKLRTAKFLMKKGINCGRISTTGPPLVNVIALGAIKLTSISIELTSFYHI